MEGAIQKIPINDESAILPLYHVQVVTDSQRTERK